MFSYVLIRKDLQFALGNEASDRSVRKISHHAHRKEAKSDLVFHLLPYAVRN